MSDRLANRRSRAFGPTGKQAKGANVTNSNAQKRPILIVGGGIGGFATALALSKKGFRSVVFEQAAEIKEIGAGIQVGPNVFHMFEKLGLSEKILSKAALPQTLVMMDGITGENVVSIPLDTSFLQRFHHPYALIHRADLHSIFFEECQKSDLIQIITSKKIVKFEDHGASVSVHGSDGDVIEGDALIGADGLWSTIRNQLVNDGPPRVSGHIAYRAVLPIEDVPPAQRSNSMTLWAGAKTHLVHYPLRGGKLFNLVAVFHSDKYVEGWDSAADSEELHRRFADATPEVKTMLAKIDTWRMWVLCDRDPIENWSKGRVTLLGDAAHPMLQYAAQGAGMSIEDAVVLADELDAGGSYEEAFLRYQKRRYLRTGKVQLTARLYGEFYHAKGVARELRNDFLKARTVDQTLDGMAWLYNGI
jgi:2-polyprenyl-6-methoxyphenol hydroxylase-like FAD-dependent oxidoreductase